jgi:hypothetical protein
MNELDDINLFLKMRKILHSPLTNPFSPVKLSMYVSSRIRAGGFAKNEDTQFARHPAF